MLRRLWYLPALLVFYPAYWLCWRAPIAGWRFAVGRKLLYSAFMMCAWTVKAAPRVHPEDEYEKLPYFPDLPSPKRVDHT